MPYWFYVISNFSIALPALAGIVRYRRVAAAWHPFLLLCCLGLGNELLSFWLMNRVRSNMVNSNCYVLAEYLLLVWQFARWNRWPKASAWYAGVSGMLAWLTDNLLWHHLRDNNSFFRVTYSVAIVLFSIDRINRLAVLEKARLWKNASFVVCTGFLLYYCMKATCEAFNLFPLQLDNHFRLLLWSVLSVINLFANLVYFGGILWIPRKEAFILHY